MKNKDLDTLEGKVSRNIRRSLFTPSLSKDNIKKESNYINWKWKKWINEIEKFF